MEKGLNLLLSLTFCFLPISLVAEENKETLDQEKKSQASSLGRSFSIIVKSKKHITSLEGYKRECQNLNKTHTLELKYHKEVLDSCLRGIFR